MTALIASPVLDKDQQRPCQTGRVTLPQAITHPNKEQALLFPLRRSRSSQRPECCPLFRHGQHQQPLTQLPKKHPFMNKVRAPPNGQVQT